MQCRFIFYKTLVCFLYLISLTAQAVIPGSELVGSTKGTFSVSPSGSASYNIPITLPPNVAGVQPNLSLNYDSAAGNGLLGMGWQLSGLSSISRCPTTLERDGYIDGVDFDNNDQFCLDGQRLVLISGNEYRTEIDSFAKITGSTNGFTVVTPSGLTMRYGTTTNSRIYLKGQSNKIMTWVLYKVEDSYGNHYTVQYENNSLSSGEYYASTINMYGKQALLSRVNLEYENRLDVISGYQAGSKYQLSKRLSAIKTYTKNSLTKQYLIDYSNAVEPLNSSYVESVDECDAFSDCLQKVEFENDLIFTNQYSLSNVLPIYLPSGRYFGHSNYTQRTFEADFNNDGLTDVFNAQDGRIAYLYLSNGSGFDAPIEVDAGYNKYFGHSNNSQRVNVGDFNGDGLADLFNANDGGTGYLYLSNGNGFDLPITVQAGAYKYFGHSNNSQRVNVGDFNGDGLADLFNANDGGTGYLYLSNGNGFDLPKTVQAGAYKYFGHSNNTQRVDVGDFNGDGLADLFNANDGGTGYLYLSNGNGFDLPITVQAGAYKYFGHSNNTQRVDVGDFNGDGLADLFNANDGGTGYLYLSNGNGFDLPITVQAGAYKYFGHSNNSQRVNVGDFNGDGLADLFNANNAGTGYIYLSNGSGFEESITIQAGYNRYFGHSNRTQRLSLGDFDGDGSLDLLNTQDGQTHYVYLNESANRAIKNINANNSSINISYLKFRV